MGLGPVLGQVPWNEKVRRTLARQRGIRLGEATVVSRQVHMTDPGTPHIVSILTTADVGQVYYGREHPGELVHVDIFHAVAEVDHRAVAASLREALPDAVLAGGQGAGKLLLDYFDLQTCTGGGRVTGDLTRGQKQSLRVAHRNHVHLSGMLPDEQLHLLLPLIVAAEEAILAQGVELRRLEKLSHARWPGGAPLDLSHYSDPNSDSWLQGPPRRKEGEGGASTSVEGSLRATRSSNSGGESIGEGQASPGTGAAGEGGGTAPSAVQQSGWESLEAERRLQAALELSKRLGSPDEVKRVLDELTREQGWASLYGSGSSQAPFVINQLESEGLVRRDIRGLRLTDEGRALAAYLDKHLRDVKLRFRKLIRRMPGSGQKKSRKAGMSRAKPSADVRYGPIRGTAPAEPGAWLGDLAVPETIRSGLKRSRLEQIHTGTAPRSGLRLQRRDVHVHLRASEQPLNICLLIDASASMAGRRILAAKHLARHLLVSTRDRIAVIAFQERDVRVYVPFTRDYAQVEEGLSRIQPMGLTPLAHGLTQSLDLIRHSRVRRPLLLLITDGIPTVAKWTIDPLTDALEAARHVGEGRIPFGCIGLQPSKRYLDELVKVAGGTLHVVEELDEDSLVNIAHLERSRLATKVAR